MSNRINILVIEDNSSDAELIRHRLKDRFDLVFASTLKEGLAALKNRFDIVLLDLNLVNGKKDKVIGDVKERHSGPIVILTGDSNPRTKDKVLLEEVDGFAVKGMDDTAADLAWIIHQAVHGRKKS